ncbi:hypothetical protein BO78DRAFT_432729 [Aspergillus sclerotiicarbonarius CBS 121057]|uniref:Transcription factor domain-containing protein n=1 Tax=Aspergillus sclerotiicarbonarius (strain CBS 121057 / IBT 28362) TaxID=1448318 RepID=A0A319E7M6_ASPSB|nr:hypothetical protein BO78DRAFT_432729 [Aspergillus sclerotiicarbonarius CBS 121057]
MRIHCLDSPKAREKRRINGCDGVEIEVQRRIWWHMVSSDWYEFGSFFLGQMTHNLQADGLLRRPQEGTYIFQRRQTLVENSRNADDVFITAAGVAYDFPRSVPTTMSASIARIELAELCEEAVNRLPFNGMDNNERDYDAVLALDAKFQEYLRNLPVFFQLHAASIQQSPAICEERPYIAWQRLILHFSAHTRLCWLHRRSHLESAVQNCYEYSREAGLRSARMVLNVRRLMDDTGPLVSMNPCRVWSVMEHVFRAAVLASVVSLYPTAVDAAARQGEVWAACRLLEQSTLHVKGIPQVLQTLRATLQGRRSRPEMVTSRHVSPVTEDEGNNPSRVDEEGEMNWNQFWADFVEAAPQLDLEQWTSQLDDIDGMLGAQSLGSP